MFVLSHDLEMEDKDSAHWILIRVVQILHQTAATQSCQNVLIILCNVSIKSKCSIIVFPMTCSRCFTFIITFYWTILHKAGGNQEFLLEVIQQPREGGKSLSTDNLGLSLDTQISFTFTALLYGSTADICGAEWKTVSLDDYLTAFQCQWSSEAAERGTLGDQLVCAVVS